MKILCICHANICRSFLAQEFLKKLLPGIAVFSRGLYADPTYIVPQKVQQALATHHIPFTGHIATALQAQDLVNADLIFCMEQAHAQHLLDRYSQHTDKIWLLTEFATGKEQDIPDPISLSGRAFEKQAQQLYHTCQAVAQRIQHDFLANQEEHL